MEKPIPPATFWRRHKTAILVIGIGVGLLILLLTLTKAYLFVRLLLGNDVLLDATGANMTMGAYQGSAVVLPFTVTVTTNPFCQAFCDATLVDVGRAVVIREEQFDVRTGDPHRTSYEVTIPERGIGQALYRWEVSCVAQATVLCHTSGIPVTREAVTIVTYGPSPATRQRLDEDRVRLTMLAQEAQDAQSLHAALEQDLAALDATIIADDERAIAIDANTTFARIVESIARAQAAWAQQDAAATASEAVHLTSDLTGVNATLTELRTRTDRLLAHHQSSIDRLTTARETLAGIAQERVDNATIVTRAQAAITQYASTRALLANTRSTLDARETALTLLDDTVRGLSDANAQDTLASSLGRDADTTMALDALCARGTCIPHAPITILASHNVTNRSAACERAQAAISDLSSANATFTTQAGADALNETLVDRATRIADDAIRNATINAVTALNTSAAQHAPLLIDILSPVPGATGETDDPGLAPLVGLSLIARIHECPTTTLAPPPAVGITPIVSSPVVPASASITFDEPVPQCCALGECSTCCDESSCRADLPAPIIILHGHAFNRDTSAAYSLDAFDKIQRELERDGYVNMGTLDLSQTGIPDGSWTRARAPVSVKASYYYDVYASPDNALLVQTKTENIDTYAIRLKEIVDEVRRRTGQDRVTIVAHSMGGLVTRRYLQIFGDEAAKRVIMIGTPNHGISGSIAEYCTYVGEDLECRDMTKGSLFLNKLERAGEPGIPVSVIIATGCDTDGEDGDGVVTAESAALPWATNRYLNGTCDRFNTLHTGMLDTSDYAITYELLREELTSSIDVS